ncbi:uncharacterized protein MONOS_10242 [Monocercomonoides exilis]|uniref:uncharacterized protein n=1 Tax=Monocercomonoides exilis TaxID=2049356 RepID=UPI003559A0B9|nr:hypothetical protein MONOS_10242 [Monocercomonoides exilis]|eukprot:MONOS_10242.1-p1 / transcript=MONOS_10242.1 / gene=MONOS_10242 / organism=Monocercomonoides_exilis_PA203 / gene_product=unspecified product / transcript_product=unspecified product / location=Mono_scaffold00457:44174-44882(-) / protein_length=212 / sequence_SO=supercontig / SO=protein_coding / is_pseudo=false
MNEAEHIEEGEEEEEEEENDDSYFEIYEMKVLDEGSKSELTKKFSKLLNELEDCEEVEQKQKIKEMNSMMDEMDGEELKSICAYELFDIMEKIIEEKKMPLENAILLLKHMGYWIGLKKIWRQPYKKPSLIKRFEKMIHEEKLKKDGKNEKFLADLCQCYISFRHNFPFEFLSISAPCLLKVALNKDESEETQKEVEMAFVALNYIGGFYV